MDELTPSWFIHVDWTGAETSRRAVAERFKLVAPIGRGGSAEVWQAEDPITGQEVAIKVLVTEVAREPFSQAQLRHEARAVSRLSHRHIVRVFDVGTLGVEVERATEGRLVAGSPFVAMELVRGGTLLPLVANARPWAEVRRCLREVLSALTHAHARGVVHLDLKPSNLLRRGHEVVLTDFGAAHIVRETHSADVGTLAYAAPEQLVGHGRDVGPRSDLFALGCVAWELLTGATPFLAMSVGERAFASPPEFKPRVAVPADVGAWLRKLLSASLQKRTRSAAEALRTLPEAGRRIPRLDSLPPSARLPDDWREEDAQPAAANVEFGLGLFGLGRVPFVGRELERDHLWKRAHALVRGEAGRVEVVGPSGSGTTRLADWLLTRLSEFDAATPLRVARSEGLEDALVRHFLLKGLSPAQAQRRIQAEVGAHWSIDEGHPNGVADAAALIEHMAGRKPVALHIEDGSPPVFRSPVLVLRTASSALHDNALVLGPFSKRERRHLLRRVLRVGSGPAKALAEVTTPGEMLALVGMWVESGQLQRDGDELTFVAQVHSHATPWRTRLRGLETRLGEGEMRSLEIAASLGQGAELAVWGQASLAAYAAPTLAALDRLTTEGLGYVEDQKIYLLNDAVRAAIIERAGSRTRGHHRACAEALRQLRPLRRSEERIGRHLHGAKELAAALPFLERGARKRLRARDPREALSLLSLHRAAQAELRQAQRLDARAAEEACLREMLLRVVCLRRVGDSGAHDLAKSAHRRARALGNAALIAPAAHQRGRVARAEANFDSATRYLLEAEGAAAESHDEGLALDIAVDLISVLLSLRLLERAEERWMRTRGRERRAVARSMLDVLGARVARLSGRNVIARQRIALAIEELTRVRPRLLPEAWSEAAEIERADEKLGAALTFYNKALEGRVSLGTAAASLQLGLGLTLGELGRWEDASTHLRGAIGAWAAQGRADLASGWTLALAWAVAHEGDWGECARLVQQSVALDGPEWNALFSRLSDLARGQSEVQGALHDLAQRDGSAP